MSQENIRLAQRTYEAFNRRDLDAILGMTDRNWMGVAGTQVLEGGTYRGHDGVREWMNNLLDVFPDFQLEIQRIRAEGDWTVATARVQAHGRGSGAPFEATLWNVIRWRQGIGVEMHTCQSEPEALQVAGLSE